MIEDRSDKDDDLENKNYDRYYETPHALKSNTGEWTDTDEYNEYDYDGDSDTSSSDDSQRSGPNNTTSPNNMPRGTLRVEPKSW